MHLYERLLGASFSALPSAMRDFHTRSHATATARFTVVRPPGLLTALVATAFALPRPGLDIPVVLDIASDGGTERWSRRFGTARFDTVQYEKNGRLVERAGLITIVFNVRADEAGMRFTSEACSIAGLRLPGWLAPSVEATALSNGDGWSMEVRVSAPRFGTLETYGGDVVPAS
jgi:hypothetical protein